MDTYACRRDRQWSTRRMRVALLILLALPLVSLPGVREGAAATAPTALGQFMADGVTAIPPGGIIRPGSAVFKATVGDASGQAVRLEVEAKIYTAAYPGTHACQSALAPPGQASCTLTGLTAQNYHWRARAVDAAGQASDWVNFSSNAFDFAVNLPPEGLTTLAQLEPDGATAIPVGGTVRSATVLFRASLTDPDGFVGLQIEVQPLGQPFTGEPSCRSPILPYAGTAQYTAECAVRVVAGRSYHWRAQALDDVGEASAWVAFGDNAEDAADFTVSTADFNADGKADLLFFHAATGGVWIGLMDGTQLTGSGVPFTAAPGWTPAGVGDFNADGKADLLFFHAATGGVWIGLMDGTQLTGSGVPFTAAPGWTP
jgi:hypothetical protein